MAGISILIFGSCYAANYYFYYCRPFFFKLYLGIAFITNLSGFLATLSEKLHKAEYTWIKGAIFGILGVGNGLSMLNAAYFSLFSKRKDDIPLGIAHYGVVFMGVLYLTGLLFYIKQIPEKYYPKVFDVWLNSHTIFHIFVFLASIEFFFVVYYLFELRVDIVCVN